jgi:hypothetical protein
MEKSMLKYYGYVEGMEDKRWRKRIMTCSPKGRRRRGRAEVKRKKEAEREMKQKNIRPNEAINRQLGRPKIYNCRDPGKLIQRKIDVYIYTQQNDNKLKCFSCTYWHWWQSTGQLDGGGRQWHGINTKFHETGALVSIILLFVFGRRQVEIRSYLIASWRGRNITSE